MPGAWKNSIEKVLNEAEQNRGYLRHVPMPLSGWYADAAATPALIPPSESTVPARDWTYTSGPLKWIQTGTTTDYILYQWTVPGDFCTIDLPTTDPEYATFNQWLRMFVPCRKKDSSTDENADLKLQVQFAWHAAGSATIATSLSTPALSASLAGAANLSSVAEEAVIDIGARLRAESKRILPGNVVNFLLSPNEAVGTTNMELLVWSPVLEYRAFARPSAL